MIVSFGEVLIDCLPSGNVIGGAPLNVIVHLKRLGHNAAIISRIGKDKYGDQINEFAISEQINDLIQFDDKNETGNVQVTINNGQPSYEIVRNTAWEFISYNKLITNPSYFVFGSLAMFSEHNRDTFKKYLDASPEALKICDINLRSPLYSFETITFCLKNCDILKINDEELDYLAKQSHTDNPITWLQSVYGIDKVLLTKGSEGADLYWSGEVYSAEAGEVNQMEDTVGAGDSFMAIFIHGIIMNKNPDTILKQASDFAAKICENKGAIPQDNSIYSLIK